jgi:cytochrome c-type biogenesis protein
MRRAIVAASFACAACAAPETRPVEVGSPAPAYSAVTLAGDSVSLNGLRGTVVLLNVWATWCHPCRAEIPMLQALHERYAARGLRIVGVSIDSPGDGDLIEEFGREHGMTYPVWHDPDDRISALYQAVGVPATYLIDRAGTLRWRRIGQIVERDPTLTRAIDDALAAGGSGVGVGTGSVPAALR